MIDGGEGGEEHMHTTAPVIFLSRRTLKDYGWVLGKKEWERGEVRVELL